jgi:hypothetical protein
MDKRKHRSTRNSSRDPDDRTSWLSRPRVDPLVFVDPLDPLSELSELTADRAREQLELARQLGWPEERLASFKQLVVAFWDKPTIENYLSVRRGFPEVEIAVARFGGNWGIDALDLEEEFEKQGVDRHLLFRALHGEEPAVDAMCLRLMECMAYKHKIPKDGRGHIEKRRKAISNATVNYLLSILLEAYNAPDREWMFQIPPSLIMLIREQLCGSNPDLYRMYLSQGNRANAIDVASKGLQPHDKISVRRLMQLTGARRMTVARWLRDPQFREELRWSINERHARLKMKMGNSARTEGKD